MVWNDRGGDYMDRAGDDARLLPPWQELGTGWRWPPTNGTHENEHPQAGTFLFNDCFI